SILGLATNPDTGADQQCWFALFLCLSQLFPMSQTKSKPAPRALELLAPARDADTAIEAIMAGADAIYIGASGFGARQAAGNSLEDIGRVVREAHAFGVKVYVTVNTIIYDHEIPEVEALIGSLYRIGVDALIVQDLGVLRMDIPPIELHASTQCDIRNAAKAEWLHRLGFTRVVLARELSLPEIAAIHRDVPGVEIEAFVHGALCVSYSGDCRASYMTGGRSANRGECAQICRLPYTLEDASGKRVGDEAHYLSLRDMNRLSVLGDMADAGVTSFKIEGRLKDAAYVKNVVAAYSRRLDAIVAESGGRYVRSSWGKSRADFTPMLDKSFNRGFTGYFITGRGAKPGSLARFQTPKAIGGEVGRVVRMAGKAIEARLSANLVNGDGLGYFDRDGRFCGFRLNRIEGNRLYPASEVNLKPGTVIYRNRDKEWDDRIASSKTRRTIEVDMSLAVTPGNRLTLTLADDYGHSATVASEPLALTDAVTPQKSQRRKILTKLGATCYAARQVVDLVGDKFVAASVLSDLRRKAVEALDRDKRATFRFGTRREEDPSAKASVERTTYRDNVANRLARRVYEEHGATVGEMAVEVERPEGETLVMNTRYCLRREMGCCLKTPEGKRMPATLFLDNPRLRLRAEFDCEACEMRLYKEP
ncbi:MAG: U32 family peptidase, partial [Duncaniella sp.]|nr:U32 family peptidase [Duncaniella sp.]